jgi:hypothetical protein
MVRSRRAAFGNAAGKFAQAFHAVRIAPRHQERGGARKQKDQQRADPQIGAEAPERLIESLHGQRQADDYRSIAGKVFPEGVVEELLLYGDAGADGTAFALLQGCLHFGPSGVVFHGVRYGLGIGKHLAIGGDEGNAGAAGSSVIHPLI